MRIRCRHTGMDADLMSLSAARMCDQRDCQGGCGGWDAERHAVESRRAEWPAGARMAGWAVSTFGAHGGFAVAATAAGVMAMLAATGLRPGPGRAR